MRPSPRWILPAFLLTGLGACAGEDSQFSAHVAPDLAREAPHPVAVFGVFRDGRMNTKAWDDIYSRLDVLGLEPCGALYDVDFVTNEGALAAAIDDYARNNGITDTLLATFGASAKADLVLVFIISGALPSKHATPESQAKPPPSPGMYRAPRTSYSARASARPDRGALEIAASLFSTRRHETVAAVSMRYTGASENEAIAQFNGKLKDLFPAASCEGWDLRAHPVDADVVRGLKEE